MKFFSIIFYSILLMTQASCVTWTSVEPASISPGVKKHFSECSGDGLIAMQVAQDGQLIASPYAEWIAEDKKQVLIDLFNPGGTMLLRFSFDAESGLRLKGADQKTAAKFSANDSILYFDGQSLHLTVYEIGCLLSYRFPEAWLADLKSSGEKNVYRFLDSRREVDLNFTEAGKVCAEIKASRLFGLYRLDRKLCFREHDGRSYGSLDIKNVGSVEWQDADDSST